MEQKDQLPRYQEFLKWYINLPNKMLSLHSKDNLTEFVLHALCNEQCFNLEKAAYFIDNADFDCVKGIAGYDRPEEYVKPVNIWNTPDEFSDHMKKCNFNKIVRSIEKGSFKKANSSQKGIAELAQGLGFQNPKFFKWNVKHDNEGILVFQAGENFDEQLLEGLSLLGFCPVF